MEIMEIMQMSAHVIVNLLPQFPKWILFHFDMEPPAEITLFHCKAISHWNILFYGEIIVFQPRL